MSFRNTLQQAIELHLRILERLADAIIRIATHGDLRISVGTVPQAGIDDRIRKIDAARENLVESLKAIDDLKIAAEDNKNEARKTLQTLEELQRTKASVEEELKNIKRLAEVDADSVRSILKLPTKSDIIRERIVGFMLGVLSSVLASVIWWGGEKIWSIFYS